MYNNDKFEVLDYQITEYRLTPLETANHLGVYEELIDLAIEEGEFDDILEYRGKKYIHSDDIKDFVLRGGIKKMQKRWEEMENE